MATTTATATATTDDAAPQQLRVIPGVSNSTVSAETGTCVSLPAHAKLKEKEEKTCSKFQSQKQKLNIDDLFFFSTSFSFQPQPLLTGRQVLQEFVVVDLPPEHPIRRQQEKEQDVPVPAGVEEDEEEEAEGEEGKEKESDGDKPSSTSSSRPSPFALGFLDEKAPLPVRLPDRAYEIAQAPLRKGDERGAAVLREVFGEKMPWKEAELFPPPPSSTTTTL